MAKVKFTSALRNFFPDLKETEVSGKSVNEVLKELETTYPGISGYLLEDDGQLRKHVNIFLKESLVTDRHHLTDVVHQEDEILIYQALSGG